MRKPTILILMVLAGVLAGCQGGLTDEEIVAHVLEKQNDIRTYRVDGDMVMAIDMQSDMFDMRMDAASEMRMAFDLDAQEAEILMTMTTNMFGETSSTTKMYIKDGKLYTQMYGRWVETELDNDVFASQNGIDQATQFLALGEYEITEQNEGGTSYYVLDVDVDPKKLLGFLMQEEDAAVLFDDEDSQELLDAIKEYRLTLYVNKNTLYIERMNAKMRIEMTSEEGVMTMDMDMEMRFYDFNEPIAIVLPPEAVEAEPFGLLPNNPSGLTGGVVASART